MRGAFRSLRECGFLGWRGAWSFGRALLGEGPNAAALLGFRARLDPRGQALNDGATAMDWRELHLEVEALAAELVRQTGLGPGLRVALLARRGIPFVEAFFALCRTGVHVTVLNPHLAPRQWEEILEGKGFAVVLAEDEFRQVASGAHMASALSLDQARERSRIGAPGRLGPRRGGTIAVFTGGTTGRARVAPRRSSPLVVAMPLVGLLFRVDLHRCRALAIGSPVHHGYGLSTLLIGTFLGPALHVWDRWETDQVCDRIRRHRIDTVAAVPLMLARLLDRDPGSLGTVERFLCGGARLDPALALRGLQAMGGALHNLYGSTEAGFSVLATPGDLRLSPDSLGRPLPGVRVTIVDRLGREVPRGETGEIAVRSSWAMDSMAGRICRTGDLGRQDEEGLIHFGGRADDMAVSGGENIHPADLEDAALGHPHVREAAAWPVADPEFGQRLVLAVASRDASLTVDSLRGWLLPRVARFQMPVRIAVVEEIPWTAAGKPDRRILEDLAS